MDEFSGVGAFYFRPTDSAVGEATNFFDVGLDVQFGVGSFDEVAIFEGLAGGRVDDGVDKVIAMGIVGAFEDGVIAGWEAQGGFIACFVAGGMVMAARASWEGRWSRRLWTTALFEAGLWRSWTAFGGDGGESAGSWRISKRLGDAKRTVAGDDFWAGFWAAFC